MGADEYIRTYRGLMRTLAAKFVEAIGGDNAYKVFDEEASWDAAIDVVKGRKRSAEDLNLEVEKLKEMSKKYLGEVEAVGSGVHAPHVPQDLAELEKVALVVLEEAAAEGAGDDETKWPYIVAATKYGKVKKLH